MRIPEPRGSLTSHVCDALGRAMGTHPLHWVEPDDVEDQQLALWTLQQLSYQRFDGVDPAWEEDASFLALRATLEQRLEADLRATLEVPSCAPADVPTALQGLVEADDGPSLSQWMVDHGTLDHLREFVLHRAAYQLREADPHSFAIPRLGPSVSKTALLQLQLDEYGGSEPTEAHAALFEATMEAVGLPAEADVDRLPATTLATNTLLSWFGRSRRLLPACLGHLAVFEITSVEPMARYAAACRRLLREPARSAAARFYDVHVAADGLHGAIALDRMVAGFVADHPDEVDDLLFGAAAVLHVERRFAEHLLAAWERGGTSLRTPLPDSDLTSEPTLAIAS